MVYEYPTDPVHFRTTTDISHFPSFQRVAAEISIRKTKDFVRNRAVYTRLGVSMRPRYSLPDWAYRDTQGWRLSLGSRLQTFFNYSLIELRSR